MTNVKTDPPVSACIKYGTPAISGLSALGLSYARIRSISDHISEYPGRVIIFLGCFFFLYLACMYFTNEILRVLRSSGYAVHGVELYVLTGCVLICGAVCAWFSCSTELAYTSKLAHDVISDIWSEIDRILAYDNPSADRPENTQTCRDDLDQRLCHGGTQIASRHAQAIPNTILTNMLMRPCFVFRLSKSISVI